jgi:hypothetical protein
MRVKHNGTLLNISILLKETRNLSFRETGMDASHEEVGARVAGRGILIIGLAVVLN